MNEPLKFWINLLVFQAAWFACVLGSKSSYPMIYPVLGFCAVLGLVIVNKRFGSAFPFLLSSVVLGMVGDSLLVRLELLAFYANPTVGGAPLWMIILWANFGLMLRALFPWFLENNFRCLLGFSIGGVVAYYAGWRMDALAFTTGWFTALAIFIEWGIAGLVLRQVHLKYPKITDESA
ncbi:MAG: DUF2878 domain-containing protein [Opitutae bacterium]